MVPWFNTNKEGKYVFDDLGGMVVIKVALPQFMKVTTKKKEQFKTWAETIGKLL